MPSNKVALRLSELEKALSRLQEILDTPPNHIGRVDAMIQRFEFSFELMWKSAKACLELQGIEASSPREVLQKSYGLKWIDNEALWLMMLNDRNLTSHTYHEAIANEIMGRIQSYHHAMTLFLTELSEVQKDTK